MADRYASLKQGLVGCWIPSVSGSGLLLPDLSGRGNNGALTNMDASDWVSGQYGRALDFDGSDDQVLIGSLSSFSFIQNTHVWSCSTWFKLSSTASAQTILGNTPFSSGDKGFAIYYETGRGLGNGVIRSGVTRGAGLAAQTYQFRSPDNSIADTNWHHVCAGMSGLGLPFIYIDGVQQSITVLTSDTTLSSGDSTRQLGLGYAPFTSITTPLTGNIDDARIYNRALTESEIRLLASEPGIGFKPAKKLSRFSQRLTYKPPKAKVFEGVRVRDHDYASLRVGLVGAWCPSLPNGGSGNTLPDVSGRGNHGTLTNMGPEDWVSGQYGRALDFDGTDDYTSIAHSSFINASNAFSLSCWIRTGADITTEQHVVTKSFLSPSLNIGYRLYIQTSTFAWYLSPDGGAAPNRVFRSSTAIAANTLYHVVGTFLGSTLLDVYLNGRLANSGLTGTIPASVFATSAPLLFGAQGNTITTATGFFAGRLDDVRLYNRVLSQSEIRLLASEPGIGLQPSPTRFIAREKKTGLRRKILTGQT